jgi:hypothetical protein
LTTTRPTEGIVADRASQLVLAALSRAAAEAAGTPLVASRAEAGLFPATAAGRLAAQKAQDDGHLAPDGTITARGLGHLLAHNSPRQVLEDFVRVLEARHEQARDLLDTARKMLAGIEGLSATLLPVLERLGAERKADFRSFHDPSAAIIESLKQRAEPGDCPLPDLFRAAGERLPGLTLGAFHDALRKLIRQGLVYPHPWTAPLYSMPEPECALVTGHQVTFYASIRSTKE